MTNFLEKIHARKRQEILSLKEKYVYTSGVMDTSFSAALEKTGIIAEIKRKSPSKGVLAKIERPSLLAKEYEEAGAVAISCLTDSDFGASIEDLKEVSQHVSLPLLRKDFIIDLLQIVEAKENGASAVLLIVKLLGDRLEDFIAAAHEIGVEALVEIHNEAELDLAIDAGAKIIGINNRNLETFEVDPRTSLTLYQKIPEGIHIVIESGITHPRTAHFFFDHGVSACLVGEALVTTKNRKNFIQNTLFPSVKICGVRSREVARHAGDAGVDFIGIVCEKTSKRFVAPENVKNVADGAKEGGAVPVCVFTDHSLEEMRNICFSSGVSIVQLHGKNSSEQQVGLPDDFIRFFVQMVEADGSYTPLTFASLNPKRDYILYDCKTPGSGTSFDWARFVPQKGIPFLLAGGLTASNVDGAKIDVPADGFDVSSGVENARGNKEVFLIEEFVRQVKK